MSQIQGNDLVLKLSSDGTYYKSLVCEIGSTLNKERATNTVETKCNSGTTLVSLGAKSATIDFTAVVETAPTANTQCSYEDLTGWFENGTYLYFKFESPAGTGTDIYEQGRTYLTSLSLDSQVSTLVQFSGTLTVDGAIDITP